LSNRVQQPQPASRCRLKTSRQWTGHRGWRLQDDLGTHVGV
jgi:hypothetical protein